MPKPSWGALEVVYAAEIVEAPLLRSQAGARRPGGFPLEIAVHALARRVLPRLAGFDELRDDPKQTESLESPVIAFEAKR